MNRRQFLRGAITVGLVASIVKGRLLENGGPYGKIELTYAHVDENEFTVVNANGHDANAVYDYLRDLTRADFRVDSTEPMLPTTPNEFTFLRS